MCDRTLTPLTVTANGYITLFTLAYGDASTENICRYPQDPVCRNQLPAVPPQLNVGADFARPRVTQPYKFAIKSYNLEFKMVITSQDFDASTVCVITDNTYPVEPAVTPGPGLNSVTVTGDSTTTFGAISLTCYKQVNPISKTLPMLLALHHALTLD